MRSIASSSRSIKPSVSYHDAQPAVGKLRPWTRQKVEANARVKERAQVRRAEDAAKKDALIKFHEQPSSQRRADPKFQKAERDTSAQIGKVFAALAGGDERIAGKLCAGLPSLMKPGTDRNMSADAYDRNLREILDHKVGKMTDAELQAVAKGVDGITHFRSDQADLHAVAQAVTSERARRQPQLEAALHACKSLSGGDLSGALKGIQRARGDRDNRMDWKSTMADMSTGQLMTLLEQFTPTKNGGPSVATQTLSSMNFISKEAIGTEHPEIRQTGNDMTAIVTAAWDLLPEGSRQHIDLNEAVKQIKNATSVSDDAAVRDALRKGFGLEISNEKQMIFTGGRAGATVDANVRKDLASYNLNAGKKKGPQEAYQGASTRVRESINVTAATAKSPFIRPDGKPGSLPEQSQAAGASVANEDRPAQAANVERLDIDADEAPPTPFERLGLSKNYTQDEFRLASAAALRQAQGDEDALQLVHEAIRSLTPSSAKVAHAQPAPALDAQPVAQAAALNKRMIERSVAGRPAGSPRGFTYSQFKAEDVLYAANNPIYDALKARARDAHNEINCEFLEKATRYKSGQMVHSWERDQFGQDMRQFVEELNLSAQVKDQLETSMKQNWRGFEAALDAAVKTVHADVMQNTFTHFLTAMAQGKSELRGVDLGKAQRYLERLAPTPAAKPLEG